MKKELDKDQLKFICWSIVILPFVFLNLLPYAGVEFIQSNDSEAAHDKLVFGFSLAFIVFFIGAFASYQCIRLSEIAATKACASFALVLYVLLLFAVIHFYPGGSPAMPGT